MKKSMWIVLMVVSFFIYVQLAFAQDKVVWIEHGKYAAVTCSFLTIETANGYGYWKTTNINIFLDLIDEKIGVGEPAKDSELIIFFDQSSYLPYKQRHSLVKKIITKAEADAQGNKIFQINTAVSGIEWEGGISKAITFEINMNFKAYGKSQPIHNETKDHDKYPGFWYNEVGFQFNAKISGKIFVGDEEFDLSTCDESNSVAVMGHFIRFVYICM